MSLKTVSIAPGGSARPCLHVRQHHPGAPERILPCAWPDCDVGVGERRLSIGRENRSPPLLVERRLLFLAGAEEMFIWHPCANQE
ncbi:MAG TPA: hypothetical protein VFN91_12215 [Myxococcaceae bacterium]|nr:hypothetical protein [Myxococcaceae bacterium]